MHHHIIAVFECLWYSFWCWCWTLYIKVHCIHVMSVCVCVCVWVCVCVCVCVCVRVSEWERERERERERESEWEKFTCKYNVATHTQCSSLHYMTSYNMFLPIVQWYSVLHCTRCVWWEHTGEFGHTMNICVLIQFLCLVLHKSQIKDDFLGRAMIHCNLTDTDPGTRPCIVSVWVSKYFINNFMWVYAGIRPSSLMSRKPGWF